MVESRYSGKRPSITKSMLSWLTGAMRMSWSTRMAKGKTDMSM